MEDRRQKESLIERILDPKVLTAAGGIILAAFALYLYSQSISENNKIAADNAMKFNNTVQQFNQTIIDVSNKDRDANAAALKEFTSALNNFRRNN